MWSKISGKMHLNMDWIVRGLKQESRPRGNGLMIYWCLWVAFNFGFGQPWTSKLSLLLSQPWTCTQLWPSPLFFVKMRQCWKYLDLGLYYQYQIRPVYLAQYHPDPGSLIVVRTRNFKSLLFASAFEFLICNIGAGTNCNWSTEHN